MGKVKPAFEVWAGYQAGEWWNILRDLVALEDGELFNCPEPDVTPVEDLIKRARMALEATNLGGPPPLDWRTTKIE